MASLATINLFFLLVFLFGYSPLSLLFLFVSWLIMTGITLHLIFLATSEDDYQLNFSVDQGRHRKSSIEAQAPLDERDEYVSPTTLLKVSLELYKTILTLYM